MAWGRVLSSSAACVAVAACAVLALGMAHADTKDAAHRAPATPSPSTRDPFPVGTVTDAPQPLTASSSAISVAPKAAATTHPVAKTPVAARPAVASTTAPPPVAPATRPAPAARPRAQVTHRTVRAAPKAKAKAKPASTHKGASLPLRYGTGSATRVITVVASHTYSTTAKLQAWTKASGGGWTKYGSAVTANVGSQGLSTQPSEFKSATPIGSFTLTQAFGYYSNPGTKLKYFTTTANDWWISHKGSTYNTHQRCSGCASTGRGDEHLKYETPFYNYAVVINYNTSHPVYPKGSAFFLHVAHGGATAGCVSISQSKLVSLLRWLTPSAHPRILIGVS